MVEHGQYGIDTSRVYSECTSEEARSFPTICVRIIQRYLQFLAKLDLKGMRIDTKVFPVTPGGHASAQLKETFKSSLEALGPHKIRVFYLHIPDRSVPFEDTLRAVDELFKAGHLCVFRRLSSFYNPDQLSTARNSD